MPQSSRASSSTLMRTWRAYSHRSGAYQATVLASIVYYFILGPSALIGRLFGAKLLDTGEKQRPSYWLDRPKKDATLADAERQF